jgi:hypothetical protein
LEVLQKIPIDLVDPRDYHRIIFTLEGIAQCKSWSDVCLSGLSKPEWVMLKRRSPEFLLIAREAEKIAADIRHMEREEEAHSRAVNGELTPTVAKDGHIVDWYPKRSDKLLELLLKANDPKYREPKSDGAGAGRVTLQVSFAIPPRSPQPVTLEGEAREESNPVEKAPERPGLAAGSGDRSVSGEAGS